MINSDAPDPTVVESGSTLYAYTTNISVFGTWYNTPVWSSTTDGATWKLERDALPAPGSWTEGQGFVWAPGVIRLGDGTWNLYYAARMLGSTANPQYRGAGMQCIGVATATSPLGPFISRPTVYGALVCQWDLGGSIDPKPVYGDDGGLRLAYKSDENAPFIGQNSRLWSSRLTGNGLAQAAPPVFLLIRDRGWEWPLIENPSMFKAGGRWWMTYAGGSWDSSGYATGLATCSGPDGPCAKVSSSPWLASGNGIAGPGGADFYRTADDRLFMAYAGWDPAAIGYGKGGWRWGFGQRVAASQWGLLYANPFGNFDGVADTTVGGTTAGTITATGWAIDPDTNDSIIADVYVDGVFAASSTASRYRPDVTAPDAWAGYGANHGFSVTMSAASGTHNVCVYAINVAAGTNSSLGCRSVTVVAGRPFGSIDAVSGSDGSVRVVGSAADPDLPAGPVDVRLTLDGSATGTVSASLPRDDFATAHPGYGAAHGFDTYLPAAVGSHTVCVTAVNVGQGADTSLGCRTVNVTGPPTSYAPAVASNADGRLETFTTDETGRLIHKWQVTPNGTWSAWATLSGARLAGPPVIATNSDGRLEAFGVAADGSVLHIWQVTPNGTWSGTLGEPGMSVPDRTLAVVRNADGRLEMFARAADSSIYNKWQVAPNSGWSGWSGLGGSLASSPTVTTGIGGRLEMFVQASNRELLTTHQVLAGSAWVPWSSLGGTIRGRPTVVHNALGRLSVFASSGSGVTTISETNAGVSWGGWANLGGNFRSGTSLSAAKNANGAMQVFATDAAAVVMVVGQIADGSGPWASTWTPLVQGARNGTTAATNADGRLEVFFTTTDGYVGHSWQLAPNGTWSGLAIL